MENINPETIALMGSVLYVVMNHLNTTMPNESRNPKTQKVLNILAGILGNYGKNKNAPEEAVVDGKG